jgi:hypothetical protein
MEHRLLSEFDEKRKVRELITDRRTVTLPVRTLNNELTCSVCLGISRECTCVMECLHRFCAGCIEKCLRLGKKEVSAAGRSMFAAFLTLCCVSHAVPILPCCVPVPTKSAARYQL